MTMQLTQSVRRAAQVNGNGIATQDGSAWPNSQADYTASD